MYIHISYVYRRTSRDSPNIQREGSNALKNLPSFLKTLNLSTLRYVHFVFGL